MAAAHDHDIREHLEAIANNQSNANAIRKAWCKTAKMPKSWRCWKVQPKARAAWRPKLRNALDALERQDFSAQVMADFLAATHNEGAQVLMTMEYCAPTS